LVGTLCAVIQLSDIHMMTLTLQYMQRNHINDVSEIDRLSFDPPWPKDSYSFEINQSTVSHMVVLEQTSPPPADALPKTGIRRFIDRLFMRNGQSHSNQIIVGYGGLWKIADEAHISTIAIHPNYRGYGYGEILLAGMYQKAIMLRADYMVLEVRVSNYVAQALYHKYGFTEFDVKKNYYRSNKEDAYDMRVTFNNDLITKSDELYATLRGEHAFVDHYSKYPHPRYG
jgi:[ribosomal protein S18]-alanine N-acetyltransferase